MTHVSLMKQEVGAHVPFQSNYLDTIKTSIYYGLYSIQVFMGNPKSANKRTIISKEDVEETNKLLTSFPVNIYNHFPYTANMSGKCCCNGLAWSGDSSIDNNISMIMKSIEYELSVTAQFKCKNGVIIHPGAYPDRDKGLQTIVQTIDKINFPANSSLLLENSAGEGNKLCKNIDELAIIMNNVQEKQRKNLGICIDTCHGFASGLCDFRNVDDIRNLFDEIEHKIGLDKLCLIHLNDSKTGFGSKKDRHETLGKGEIWKNGFDSLTVLLQLCDTNDIPYILETPDPRTDIHLINSIM